MKFYVTVLCSHDMEKRKLLLFLYQWALQFSNMSRQEVKVKFSPKELNLSFTRSYTAWFELELNFSIPLCLTKGKRNKDSLMGHCHEWKINQKKLCLYSYLTIAVRKHRPDSEIKEDKNSLIAEGKFLYGRLSIDEQMKNWRTTLLEKCLTLLKKKVVI